MVLRKGFKKLLIIALAAVTIVWFIALYLHIQGYNRYMQDVIERYGEDFVREWLDGPPIWAWRFGLFLQLSAVIILFVWVRVIILAFRYMLRSHKQNNV